MFKSKKKIVLSAVAIIIVLFVLVNVCASIFFSTVLFKKDGWKVFEKYSYGEELKYESEWISDKSKMIETENAEGKALTALEIKNEHISHSYVVMCHQYGGSPESMEEYANHFYNLGFNVILPFMRGHGESSYDSISFGWGDGVDVIAWVEKIIKEDDEARIALFGVSLGANAVTLAAAEELPSNVRLVISDSCYTSFDALIKEYTKTSTHFSSLITVPIISGFAGERIEASYGELDTVSQLENIEVPIMFINGENDTVVPPLVSKKLYEICEAEGVEELLVEEGAHGRNLEADKESYWANVDSFILHNIGI